MCLSASIEQIPGFSCKQLRQGYPGLAWVGSKDFVQSDGGNIAMVDKRGKKTTSVQFKVLSKRRATRNISERDLVNGDDEERKKKNQPRKA